MQKVVVSSRFLNQLGVHIILFLSPILILKMTGSAIYAGASLILEWLPKLVVYLKSSSILSWYKTKNVVLVCHMGRLTSILLILLSIYYNNVYLLLLALPILQSSNAISNILTENLISTWWEKEKWRKAHSLLINLGLLITLLMLPLAIMFSIESMLYCGLLAFVLGLSLDNHNRDKLYVHFEHSVEVDYKQIIKDVYKNKKLISLSILGLAVCIQSALIYSNMVFFLMDLNKVLAESVEFNSQVKALVGIFAILWVSLFVYVKSANTALKLNIIIMFLMNVLIFFTNQILLLVIGAIMIQLAFYGYHSISRALRQSLITNGNAIRYTGILIANEAAGIMVAGLLMIIFASHIKYTLIFSSLFLIWAYYNFKSKVSVSEIELVKGR